MFTLYIYTNTHIRRFSPSGSICLKLYLPKASCLLLLMSKSLDSVKLLSVYIINVNNRPGCGPAFVHVFVVKVVRVSLRQIGKGSQQRPNLMIISIPAHNPVLQGLYPVNLLSLCFASGHWQWDCNKCIWLKF